jgi:hypothetical protein
VRDIWGFDAKHFMAYGLIEFQAWGYCGRMGDNCHFILNRLAIG